MKHTNTPNTPVILPPAESAAPPATPRRWLPVACLAGAVGAIAISGILAQQVIGLSHQVAALRDTPLPAATPSDPGNTQELRESLTQLNTTFLEHRKQLDALQQQHTELKGLVERKTSVDGETLQRRLDEISGRLMEAERQIKMGGGSHGMSQPFTMLNALWVLQFQITNAMPFRSELRALEVLAKDHPQILAETEALKPYAEEGIQSLDELRTTFQHVIKEVVTRKKAVKQEQGWWGKTLVNLSQVVTIRKMDDGAESEDPEILVSRAERQLAEGDLNLAVGEVEKLPPEYHDATTKWVEAARAKLAAEQSIRLMYETLLDFVEGAAGL